jgi:hypothetical protein
MGKEEQWFLFNLYHNITSIFPRSLKVENDEWSYIQAYLKTMRVATQIPQPKLRQ